MSRWAIAGYGMLAYTVFLGTILYAIGFVGNWWVPKSIDSGAGALSLSSVAVDAALLTLFASQHSVMARPWFKRWWTRLVPHAIERSTYVLCASASLLLLFWQWRPLPELVWSAPEGGLTRLLQLGCALGWALVFAATFMINHFELFGLQQVYLRWRGRARPEAGFKTPYLYRFLRHPIYLGFLIAFWSAPRMTLGHLLFAGLTSAYILLGIQLEERDLIAQFGEAYRSYRSRAGMLLPRLRPGAVGERPPRAVARDSTA